MPTIIGLSASPVACKINTLLRQFASWYANIAANGYGLWALAVCGNIRCRGTTKWMREQNLQIARQPACAHRRVLCASSLVVYRLSFSSVTKRWILVVYA